MLVRITLKNQFYIERVIVGHRLELVSLAFEASKPGVRPKSKTDSQREPVLLCSLTPARLIRIKRITSDEA